MHSSSPFGHVLTVLCVIVLCELHGFIVHCLLAMQMWNSNSNSPLGTHIIIINIAQCGVLVSVVSPPYQGCNQKVRWVAPHRGVCLAFRTVDTKAAQSKQSWNLANFICTPSIIFAWSYKMYRTKYTNYETLTRFYSSLKGTIDH